MQNFYVYQSVFAYQFRNFFPSMFEVTKCFLSKVHNSHMRSLDGTVFLSSMADILTYLSTSLSLLSLLLPISPFCLSFYPLRLLFSFLSIHPSKFAGEDSAVDLRCVLKSLILSETPSLSLTGLTHTQRERHRMSPLNLHQCRERHRLDSLVNHYLPVGSFHCERPLFQVGLIFMLQSI